MEVFKTVKILHKNNDHREITWYIDIVNNYTGDYLKSLELNQRKPAYS